MRFRTQAPRKALQAGFTLIELIVVIVIIGILAAIAIPKFSDLTTEAEKAAVKGVAAEFAAAGAIEYARVKSAGTGTIPACDSVIGLMSIAPAGYTVSGGTGYSCTAVKTVGGASAPFTLPNP